MKFPKTSPSRLFAAVLALSIWGATASIAVAQPESAQPLAKTLKASFQSKGQATLDRLDQTALQKTCSAYATRAMPARLKRRLEKAALATVRYPADGQYLGDWQQGEKIAQYGRGFQYSDKPDSRVGGNCYACHQLSSAEVSYGTMGPSLYHYGKLRGRSQKNLRYTWARLWNSHAFAACNVMPRFGDAGILTEAQLKHLMALLLDPGSPVNQ